MTRGWAPSWEHAGWDIERRPVGWDVVEQINDRDEHWLTWRWAAWRPTRRMALRYVSAREGVIAP